MAIKPTGSPEKTEKDNIECVVDVVSAFLANNKISSNQVSDLIISVKRAFYEISSSEGISEKEEKIPAVDISKSITDKYIICLEDGLKFKSLKRHIEVKYDMTPAEYRKKWGLPSDYPMVSPSYSRERSVIARNLGLGQLGKKTSTSKSQGSVVKSAAAKKLGTKPSKSKTVSR